MPLIEYVTKNFAASSLAIIEQANDIIAEYMRKGFSLTLRQLYYQFVARDLIPNKQQEYKRLGGIISDARLAGLIDWDAIEDRTRMLRGVSPWEDIRGILNSSPRAFRIDKWDERYQTYHPEVWIEKDALVGVIQRVCSRHEVDYFSCRGYTSQSELWRAGQRMESYISNGQVPLIIHLGDHDPSGIDMTRDVRERVQMFGGNDIEVVRIALNMDQVEEQGPPPNPAKLTDSRAGGYISKYGRDSWELDALRPEYIADIVEEHILRYRDNDGWDRALQEQQENRDRIQRMVDSIDVDGEE